MKARAGGVAIGHVVCLELLEIWLVLYLLLSSSIFSGALGSSPCSSCSVMLYNSSSIAQQHPSH